MPKLVPMGVAVAISCCLILFADAQTSEWKAIACTTDIPEGDRGTVRTIYFSEGGKVHFQGKEILATVSSAEINFCTDHLGPRVCLHVSRITAQFSHYQLTPGVKPQHGLCVLAADKPKF